MRTERCVGGWLLERGRTDRGAYMGGALGFVLFNHFFFGDRPRCLSKDGWQAVATNSDDGEEEGKKSGFGSKAKSTTMHSPTMK